MSADAAPGEVRPGATDPVTIALVDDDAMVRDGLEAWLTRETTDVRVAISVPSWVELMEHPAFPVSVVLLDFQLRDDIPPTFKIATLRTAGVGCVIVSAHATAAEVRSCINAGALGYLPKSEPALEMIRASRCAARGQSYMTPILAALLVADREQSEPSPEVPRLSPQEVRALALYASGLPMKNVARHLNVSYETAKGYIDRVREKYAQAGRTARTKIELYQRAREDGFVSQ